MYSDYRIAVIGDYMLDEWWKAQSIKISPEAPVPDLINPTLQRRSAGGAGNVAKNLLALGAKVDCYGIWGDDAAGDALNNLLSEAGAVLKTWPVAGFVTHKKIRYTSDGQTVFRVSMDASRAAIPGVYTIECFNSIDALVVADYNKGVMTAEMIEGIMLYKKPVFVDPKHDNFWLYKGAEIIKCNEPEAQRVVCELLGTPPSDTLISTRWGACIAQKLETNNVIITRGALGMNVTNMEETGEATWVPGRSVAAIDVAGAGDTAIAVLTLEYLRTKDIVKSAYLANYACSLVVQKRGTAVVTLEELEEALGDE